MARISGDVATALKSPVRNTGTSVPSSATLRLTCSRSRRALRRRCQLLTASRWVVPNTKVRPVATVSKVVQVTSRGRVPREYWDAGTSGVGDSQ
jgi:hypothetical protein